MSVIEELKEWLVSELTYYENQKHLDMYDRGSNRMALRIKGKIEELQARECQHEYISVCDNYCNSAVCSHERYARCRKCGDSPALNEARDIDKALDEGKIEIHIPSADAGKKVDQGADAGKAIKLRDLDLSWMPENILARQKPTLIEPVSNQNCIPIVPILDSKGNYFKAIASENLPPICTKHEMHCYMCLQKPTVAENETLNYTPSPLVYPPSGYDLLEVQDKKIIELLKENEELKKQLEKPEGNPFKMRQKIIVYRQYGGKEEIINGIVEDIEGNLLLISDNKYPEESLWVHYKQCERVNNDD